MCRQYVNTVYDKYYLMRLMNVMIYFDLATDGSLKLVLRKG